MNRLTRLASLLMFASVLPVAALAMAAPAVDAPEGFGLGKAVAAPEALSADPAKPGSAKKPATTKAQPGKGKAPKSIASNRGKATAGKVAAKSKSRKKAEVIATDIPAAKLDLSLPKDMVKQLQPPGKPERVPISAAPAAVDGKPLLPSLFAPKVEGEPFELNGRLLTNEMDLQLRNDSRREVDGAALDFKFKQ
ncbi:translation initiation factor 2 [Pseudomonas sp. DC3200b2]|uniref:translation initiation factor 2 n=1 Tax=Pseudomonas sp. DC3200b2 TaxID=2804669 RepID=UPI003CF93511